MLRLVALDGVLAPADVLRMLRHQHPDVRWSGVQCLVHLCHLPSSSAAKLHSALLGVAEAAACRLRYALSWHLCTSSNVPCSISAHCQWGDCCRRWQQDCEHVQLAAALPWVPATGSPPILQPDSEGWEPQTPASGTALLSLSALRHVRWAAVPAPDRLHLCSWNRGCVLIALCTTGPASGSQWADVGGILLQACKPPQSSTAAGFVTTAGLQKALHAAALAISQQRPVLLEGPAGASLADCEELDRSWGHSLLSPCVRQAMPPYLPLSLLCHTVAWLLQAGH